MTEIVAGSFYDCRQLKWVKLPQGLTTIATSAFDSSTALESVTPFLPDTLTSIGASAFYNCTALEGDLKLHGPSLSIGHNNNQNWRSAFVNTAITSADITAPLAGLDGYLFSGCARLASVSLPDTVTSFGGYCFSGCSSLPEITVPQTVSSIGDRVFATCSALTNVYFRGTVPTTRNANAFFGQAANRIRVFVPSDDPAWTQDFYGANVTPMDETLRVAYRAIFPTGKMAKGQFTWSTKMWFCTWDPHASRTIIILR